MHIVYPRSDSVVATSIPDTTAASDTTTTTTPSAVVVTESSVPESSAPSHVPQGWIIFAVIAGVAIIATVVVSVLVAKAKRRQRLQQKAARFHHIQTSPRSSRRTYSRLSKRSMAERAMDAEEQRSLMITKSLASRSGSIGSISLTGSEKAANRTDALKELEAGMMYQPQQQQHPIAKHPFWSPDIPSEEMPASRPINSRSRSGTVDSTASYPAPSATILQPPSQYYYPEAVANPPRAHFPQQR